MSAAGATLSVPLGDPSYRVTVSLRLQRRKQDVRLPEPGRARPPARASYRRLVVALSPGSASEQAVRIACELASDRGARLTAVAAIEVPLDVPLASPDREAETAAREAVRAAQALGSTYGVSVDGVVLHAREAAEAILDEVRERVAQVVVLAAEWPQGRGRLRRLSRTTAHVLKHARCRVLLVGGAAASRGGTPLEPVFRSGGPSDYWPAGEFVDPDATSR